jgi:hypothetical protein
MTDRKLLVPMADGGIIEFDSDNSYSPGSCDTCDYGAEYVTEFKVYLTKSTICVEVTSSGSMPLSTSDLFEIFLPNLDLIKTMTEKAFAGWLEVIIRQTAGRSLDYQVRPAKKSL